MVNSTDMMGASGLAALSICAELSEQLDLAHWPTQTLLGRLDSGLKDSATWHGQPLLCWAQPFGSPMPTSATPVTSSDLELVRHGTGGDFIAFEK
jgi:hypothetical protein